jgi:hypothetical protein
MLGAQAESRVAESACREPRRQWMRAAGAGHCAAPPRHSAPQPPQLRVQRAPRRRGTTQIRRRKRRAAAPPPSHHPRRTAQHQAAFGASVATAQRRPCAPALWRLSPRLGRALRRPGPCRTPPCARRRSALPATAARHAAAAGRRRQAARQQQAKHGERVQQRADMRYGRHSLPCCRLGADAGSTRAATARAPTQARARR